MCKVCDQIEKEFGAFHATGELPPAWEPTRYVDDEEFDRRVDEINREMEDIESGCVEPPPGGWLPAIVRRP